MQPTTLSISSPRHRHDLYKQSKAWNGNCHRSVVLGLSSVYSFRDTLLEAARDLGDSVPEDAEDCALLNIDFSEYLPGD